MQHRRTDLKTENGDGLHLVAHARARTHTIQARREEEEAGGYRVPNLIHVRKMVPALVLHRHPSSLAMPTRTGLAHAPRRSSGEDEAAHMRNAARRDVFRMEN